ncbi:MAG: hypothetical protein H7255_11580 [Ramlibacter sp.]|nr:hypothetical protein [Ramlibacter sp.]
MKLRRFLFALMLVAASAPVVQSAAPAATPASSSAAASATAPGAAAVATPAASAPLNAASMAGGQLALNGWSSRLHLLANPVVLPVGRVGAPYPRVRIVLDGVPHYNVGIEGPLPVGLVLGEDGFLTGTPKAAGANRFVVRASDSSSPPVIAQQVYTLRVVVGGAQPQKPASAASAPVPFAPLSSDDMRNLSGRRTGPIALAWRLTDADFDKLAPEPPPPAPPTPSAVPELQSGLVGPPQEEVVVEVPEDPAIAIQQRLMLEPLVNTEFPSRALFEAAFDAQVCTYARELIAKVERSRGLQPSGGSATNCAPGSPAPAAAKPASAAKASRAASVAGGAAAAPPPAAGVPIAVKPADLPAWLLQNDLRNKAIVAAEKRHALDTAKPVQWTGGDCGCVHSDISGTVYGFYPFWAADGKPQQINFSLITRLGYHGATFDDAGSIFTPASWQDNNPDLASQAQAHGTHLDFVLWRNDWRSMAAMDDTRTDRVARELARGTLLAMDTPARDQASRWQRLLPFDRPRTTMADGLTVFFDNVPAATDPAAPQFYSFARKFLLQIIQQMRAAAPRTYTLNIMMTATADGKLPVAHDVLFDYIKRAEEPLFDNQRILVEGDEYKSRTNITVNYIVMLPEPTTSAKKALRVSIENAREVYGNDRRILLRKVIAGVSFGGADLQQFGDDLAYFRDNFGGVAFWQVPIVGTKLGGDMYDVVARTFRADANDEDVWLCKVVCTHRWIARAVFELLLATQLICVVVVVAMGGLRCVGMRNLILMSANLVLLVVACGALLNCDPDFLALRKSHTLLWVSVGVLVLGLAYAIGKPRDPKP